MSMNAQAMYVAAFNLEFEVKSLTIRPLNDEKTDIRVVREPLL